MKAITRQYDKMKEKKRFALLIDCSKAAIILSLNDLFPEIKNDKLFEIADSYEEIMLGYAEQNSEEILKKMQEELLSRDIKR